MTEAFWLSADLCHWCHRDQWSGSFFSLSWWNHKVWNVQSNDPGKDSSGRWPVRLDWLNGLIMKSHWGQELKSIELEQSVWVHSHQQWLDWQATTCQWLHESDWIPEFLSSRAMTLVLEPGGHQHNWYPICSSLPDLCLSMACSGRLQRSNPLVTQCQSTGCPWLTDCCGLVCFQQVRPCMIKSESVNSTKNG